MCASHKIISSINEDTRRMNHNSYSSSRPSTRPSDRFIDLGESTTELLDFVSMNSQDDGDKNLQAERVEWNPPASRHSSAFSLEQDDFKKDEIHHQCSSAQEQDLMGEQTTTLKPKSWHRPEIEVIPGYSVPLHGSEETWHAFCQGSVVHIRCMACETFLYCIDSAHMVLCPSCRMMSSVKEASDETGLGLGLTEAHAADKLEQCSNESEASY